MPSDDASRPEKPSYSSKRNEAEARERLQAFWSCSPVDRPALFALAHRNGGATSSSRPSKDDDLSPERHARAAIDFVDSFEFIAEAMPGFHVGWGAFVQTLAVFAGADYDYRSETAWTIEKAGLLDLDPPPKGIDAVGSAEETMRALDDCYRAAAAAIEGRGFVLSQLLNDPLTTLSMMCGSEEFLVALVEKPERVQAWVDSLTEMHVRIFRRYFDMAGACESMVFFGPAVRGSAESLQCDAAVMLSPVMFDEFAAPMLRTIAGEYSSTLYHLDGVEQMRFLDRLQAMPNMKGIQWNPQVDYGRPASHIDNLREIRRRGLLLYVMCDTVEDAAYLTREIGPDGLFIGFRNPFQSVSEAERAIAAVESAASVFRR